MPGSVDECLIASLKRALTRILRCFHCAEIVKALTHPPFSAVCALCLCLQPAVRIVGLDGKGSKNPWEHVFGLTYQGDLSGGNSICNLGCQCNSHSHRTNRQAARAWGLRLPWQCLICHQVHYCATQWHELALPGMPPWPCWCVDVSLLCLGSSK